MEIELKFLVDESFTRDRFFNDSHLKKMADEETMETIEMKAVYYDTEDCDMLKKEIAFRIRHEGDRPVATLKWGGGAENGLHARGELNVTVDEAYCQAPRASIFAGSEIYEEIGEEAGEKLLRPVMEMNYVRKQVRIDTGKSICVMSYDEGEITTTGGSAPISELEIELYSGDQDDMIALGQELAQKYNLQPCDVSKYQRGLELLGLA
jgi:triphosphatase